MKAGGTEDRDVKVVDFLYGEMDPSASRAFEQLLEDDAELRAEALTSRRVLEMFREGLVKVEPAPEVTARVLEAAARQVKRSSWAIWMRDLFVVPSGRYALGAALSVLLVCGAVVAVYKLKGVRTGEQAEPRARVSAAGRPEGVRQPVAESRPEGLERAGAEVKLVEKAAKEGAVDGRPDGDQGAAGKNGIESTVTASPEDQAANVDGLVAGDDKAQSGRDRRTTRTTQQKARPQFRVVGGTGKGPGPQNQSVTVTDRGTLQRKLGPQAPPRPSAWTSVPVVPPAGKKASAADAAFRNAVHLHNTGKHRQAVKVFEALAGRKDYPRRNQVLLLWAQSEMNLGRYDRAQRILRQMRGSSKAEMAEFRRLRRRISTHRAKRRYRKQSTSNAYKSYGK